MSEGPGTVGDSPPSNGGTSSLGSPLASPRGGVFMDAQQGFLTTAAGEEEDDDGPPAPKALVPASHGTPM